MLVDLLPALVMGLFGSLHCLGMCGGIIGSLSIASENPRLSLFAYNLGRIASYAFLGGILGLLGNSALSIFTIDGINVLRLIAALLIISMALYMLGKTNLLRRLESVGAVLWRQLQPLSKKLLPVTRTRQALALGALWGFLPCGLVYTALSYALLQHSVVGGAASMLAFGVGTLPGVVAIFAGAELIKRALAARTLRYASASCLLIFGFWTAYLALTPHTHNESSHHDHKPQKHHQHH